jgi:hypothetical protein
MRERIDGRGQSSHIWFHHGVTLCLKIILFRIYLYLKLTNLFVFNILSTCKYFQVPVDPQVLKNPQVFDSRLRVTRWLKPAWILV